MSPLSITAPTKPSAPPGPKSASPPPGAASDFAALLDQTSARTAPAEGPKKRAAQPESPRREAAASKDDNKGNAATDAQAATVAEQAQPQAAAEVKPAEGGQGQGQPAAGDPTATAADRVAVVGTLAADQPAVAAVTPTAVPAPSTTTPAAGTTTGAAGAMTASSVATQAAAGAAGSADAAAVGDVAAAPTDGAPAGKLQIPAELLDAKGGQAKDPKNGDRPQRDLPPAPTLPPTADAAATPTPAPASAAAPTTVPVADPGVATAPAPTAAAPAQSAAATPQPAAVPLPSGAPQLSRASVLQTAERVQELVRIATTCAGAARAVLQLRPAELGQVDVHLRTTRNGLVATIAAHEQVGHDALQQAGNELRRTLEDKGVQLHSLDLQLGAGQNGFTNQGDAREANSGRRGAAASHDLGSHDPAAEDQLTITHAPSTPAGALVDVQA